VLPTVRDPPCFFSNQNPFELRVAESLPGCRFRLEVSDAPDPRPSCLPYNQNPMVNARAPLSGALLKLP
ncbi:MAG: hypothetical protein KGL37_00035, partial [Acidobacteriota bacterium]|nr:hypothetical protein [Acidobacteriota bacterium]